MKIVELTNRLQLPITNEEADLLNKFDSNSQIAKHDLNERQQLIANQLVNKDVLSRQIHDGQIIFQKKIKKK